MPKPTVARLTSSAQLVAALPLWLGYTPTESLVVACCHEPRGRIGLTLRFDLPDTADEKALVAEVARRVRHQRATRVVVAVFTGELDGAERARGSLVRLLQQELADLVLTDAVLVREGRFFSYVCEVADCCPPEGRPVATAQADEPVRLLEAEQVLRGQVVLRDRAELEALLSGPQLFAEHEALQRCEVACGELADAVRTGARAGYRQRMLARWHEALDAFGTPPAHLDPADAAALAVSLADRWLRDQLAAEDDVTAMLALLEELCRRTPASYDAPVCTLLAWLTYCEGGGAAVTILLDRALASDPSYSLALLLQEVVLGQVPPGRLREITQQAFGRVRGDRRGRRAG
jgi:hypothetical protein